MPSTRRGRARRAALIKNIKEEYIESCVNDEEWSPTDRLTLVNSISAQLTNTSYVAYKLSADTLDWSLIKVGNKTVAAMKEHFTYVINSVKKMRTLGELITNYIVDMELAQNAVQPARARVLPKENHFTPKIKNGTKMGENDHNNNGTAKKCKKTRAPAKKVANKQKRPECIETADEHIREPLENLSFQIKQEPAEYIEMAEEQIPGPVRQIKPEPTEYMELAAEEIREPDWSIQIKEESVEYIETSNTPDRTKKLHPPKSAHRVVRKTDKRKIVRKKLKPEPFRVSAL